jgi:lipopolysaccharide/colanic/teichoic acid biosynthesis glycosyltransferase
MQPTITQRLGFVNGRERCPLSSWRDPTKPGANEAVRFWDARIPAANARHRIGRGGAVFRVPKLRTMYTGAAHDLDRTLSLQPDLEREWRESYKLRRDPRIVRGVGPVLRRFSIDELPQLWSVLKGDMSLVGPRPLPTYHLDAFTESFRRLRQQVRPGLTGLWQISARGNGNPAACEALDSYYIHNWSPWLDLYILGKTVWAVVNGRGAY